MMTIIENYLFVKANYLIATLTAFPDPVNETELLRGHVAALLSLQMQK